MQNLVDAQMRQTSTKMQFINKFPAKKTPLTSHATRQRLQALDALKGRGILKNQLAPLSQTVVEPPAPNEPHPQKQKNSRIEVDMQGYKPNTKGMKGQESVDSPQRR